MQVRLESTASAATKGKVGTVRRAARATYEYLLLYVGFAYFGVVGMLWSMVASALCVILPRELRARLGRQMIGFLFRGFLHFLQVTGAIRIDLSALDALRGEPGLVIAPNHPCLLDAVFVIAQVPEVTCIIKAQIWRNVVLGGGARMAEYIRNDSAFSMLQASARALRRGHTLLVFPEGTRTRRLPVNSFKGGFALIAKVAKVPVQTVFIETDSRFLSKGWPFLKKPAFPLAYRARLGKRFAVEGDLKGFLRQLEEYYRQELSGQTGECAPPLLHPSPSPRPDSVA